MGILVFISVLLVAACGLIYELVAGTLASYLVGDSVFQFSTIIGTYLFAMGIGSALSRYINRGLANRFVWIELLLGVIGGFSSALLMLAFAFTQGFELILYAVVIVMGVLVGLEIPLLMRIVRDRYQFRDVIAHVLTFDYLGALGASLLFPILLVPRLRLVRIGRGTCRSETDHRHGRRQHLRRRDHFCPRHPLSASRPHALQGRLASLSQQPPAIQFPRRIPLP